MSNKGITFSPGTLRNKSNQELISIVLHQEAELIRFEQWINDLQSGMYINCVYCGHRYGPGETTPVSVADALKEHIEHCPEHPLAQLRENLKLTPYEEDAVRNISYYINAEELLPSFDFYTAIDLYNTVIRLSKLGGHEY